MATRSWVGAVLVSLTLACDEPPMPGIEVSGTGASIVEVGGWTQVTSLGAPVLWRAKMTRRSEDPIAGIRYQLVGPSGRIASGTVSYRAAYDYREPFLPGDSVTLSIPAYGGGRRVDRLMIEIVRAEPPPPVDLEDPVGEDAPVYRADEVRPPTRP